MPTPFDRATVPYLLAGVGWGIALALSFSGWGAALRRALRLRGEIDAGLDAALGLALTVAAAGVGNLAGALSRGAALVWVAAGLAAFGLERARRRRSAAAGAGPGPMPAAAALVLAFLALLHLAGSVDGRIFDGTFYRAFDPHDDEQAYLAFPMKMLETGGLGPDPFDARRLVVLGGQSALQALVAALFPSRATHLLDAGTGLLVALWALLGAVRPGGLPRRLAPLPLLLLLLLPSLPARGNTTALLSGVALLVALFRLTDEEPFAEDSPACRAFPAGLVFAALVALKSTFLPAAVVFGGIAVLASGAGVRRRRVVEGLVSAAWGFVFLVPWMVSLKLSSGTFLFPLLGSGYQHVAWDTVPGLPPPPAPGERTALALASLRAAIPVALLLPFALVRSRRPAVLALGLSALALPALYRLVGDPFLERSLSRYYFPVLAWAVPLLLVAALREPSPAGATARLAGAAAIAAAAAVLVRDGRAVAGQFRQLAANVAHAVSGARLVPEAAEARTRPLLEAVPRGAAVLERLRDPYLLDFRAHRVLLCSMPGMASPPPGMPLAEGAEKVAAYLVGQGVGYLAYGSRTDAGELLELTEADIRYRYPRSRSRWAILAFHRDFHRAVRDLSFTRARLADRPGGVVLDLGERALRLPLLEARDRLEGIDEDGWLHGGARIRLDYDRSAGDRFLRVVLGPEGGDVRASLDGRPLTPVRSGSSSLVFDLAGSPLHLGTLSLASPAAEVVGVATTAAPDEAPRIGPASQRVGGPLEVAHVVWRSGIWGDGWTGGDGVFANLDWPVPAGAAILRVEIAARPPGPPAAARLRLVVNGRELEPLAATEGAFTFRLPPGLDPVRRIRILSATFVPKETEGSEDARHLGVVPTRLLLLPSP